MRVVKEIKMKKYMSALVILILLSLSCYLIVSMIYNWETYTSKSVWGLSFLAIIFTFLANSILDDMRD